MDDKEDKFPLGWAVAIVIVIFLMMAIAILAEKEAGNDPNNPGVGQIKVVEPKNYGNGVFGFNVTGSAYGNSVALFLKDNPDIVFLGASSEQNEGHGDSRIWVYTAILKPLKKNITSNIQPIDYGEGVFYFNAQSDEYGMALSAFRYHHPELEFRSANLENGQNRGTWVYFNKSLPIEPKLKLMPKV